MARYARLRPPLGDDPRRLRELVARAERLAREHGVPSVFVGLAGREGDLLFPELVRYIEGSIRVEDALFRLTRERALLLLTDTGRPGAERIVERLRSGFLAHFAVAVEPALEVRYFEVQPGGCELSVKRVLPAVFAAAGPGEAAAGRELEPPNGGSGAP